MLGIDEQPGKEKNRKSKKSSSSSSKKRRRDATDISDDDDDDDDDDVARRSLRKDRMVPSHPVTDVSHTLFYSRSYSFHGHRQRAPGGLGPQREWKKICTTVLLCKSDKYYVKVLCLVIVNVTKYMPQQCQI